LKAGEAATAKAATASKVIPREGVERCGSVTREVASLYFGE